MCGIAGFISLNHPIDHPNTHLDSALKKLQKRGPDAQGIYRDENCELGHTRLSILDTSRLRTSPWFQKISDIPLFSMAKFTTLIG